MNKRIVSMVAALGLVVTVMLAAGGPAAANTAATRTFVCTGSLGEYYTVQTVTGTLQSSKPLPTDVSVLNWQNIVQVTSPAPPMHRNFDGGYWKRTYHLNAWYVGRTTSEAYHFLLPDTPVGGTFTAMLKTDFLPNNGNWQNWMECTAG